MGIIDNTSQTMREALENTLPNVDRVDIEVAFFYFSGWRLLAESLKDKKIRILVGKYIDPDAIPELLSRIKQEGEGVDLDPYQPRTPISSRAVKKQSYVESFTRLSNESALFDDYEVQDAFKLLESKIEDGSLEIKMTSRQEHGKLYILHNKPENSDNGDYPGNVFMGSSNFTFQGLQKQGELNERFNDKQRYENYLNKFESMWEDAENIDIATLEVKDELIDQLKKDLWIYSNPSPYAIYIRVLHELFGGENQETIVTPDQITNGRYVDLEYQVDAIKSVLDKMDKYDGVILADVVGLGKSIIAAAAAHISGLRSIIIAPPHLKDQWDDYQEEFRLPGARVFSSGVMEEIHSRYKNNDQPLLIIVDEAHRFRNEDTNDYRLLHHICSSHPENKTILITATPFNNDPKDVFALIKLFQIPGQSTIRSVDNLSLRFRELIVRYKRLNKYRRGKKAEQGHIDKEADEISMELRRLIENVVIRRSRLDLRAITRYKDDLERQNIDFAEVEGPELLTYDLGVLLDLYLNTLEKITGEEQEGGFIGARYKPMTYILDGKRDEFLNIYGEDFDETDLKTAQSNLAYFMKRLLVMRFESSKEAFRRTLLNMISSTKLMNDWWHKLGKVPILKKGQIPDPESILETSNDTFDNELNEQFAEEELQKLKDSKGLISVDISLIDPQFIEDVSKDRELLTNIYDDWFGEEAEAVRDIDPKLDGVQEQISALLDANSDRKIVIFSSYADTVNYLHSELTERGVSRILKYTSADATKSMKNLIRVNFDAGIRASEQLDDYDILITTDALSEGYNLHRAGVVINYDIPYNPTRVIQRIGRINRINKKVFDKLNIYNCFPTETGESEIRIKQISTLKMRLINSIMGSDTKTLTDDEKLQSFFQDSFQKADSENESLSWDAVHRENYDQGKKDIDAFEEALNIKPRSRIVREVKDDPAIVAFGKKGDHAVFALKRSGEAEIVPAEIALNYFIADKDEVGIKADKQYDGVFKLVRDILFDKHALPKISGRRADALKILKIVEENLPVAKDYCRDLSQIIKKYDGINEGDLKRINKLELDDYEETFKELKDLVPERLMVSIIERANRVAGQHESIVLSEDLRL